MSTHEPVFAKKLSMVMVTPISDAVLVDRSLQEALRRVLDGTAPVRPRIVAEPPPLYRRLLESAAGNPLALALLELHKPKQRYDHSAEYWDCLGDEFGGYDGERPDWPCETVSVVTKHLDVEKP